MIYFELIVGLSSILSCVIAFITLKKVNSINKNINKSEQNISGNIMKNSNVHQTGRDNKGK